MKEYAAESHDACIAAENIHRLDPAKCTAIHSLERPPFFAEPQVAPDATTGGMPYGNALFAFLWFHAFIKHVNMGPYLCPSADTPLDVLFERKVPNPDGTPSDEYVINHHLVAKLCFTVACCLSASATYRKRIISVCRSPLLSRQKMRAGCGENSFETALRSGNLSSLP